MFLDTGMTVELGRTDLANFRRLFRAVLEGAGERVGELLLAESPEGGRFCRSPAAFRARVAELVSEARDAGGLRNIGSVRLPFLLALALVGWSRGGGLSWTRRGCWCRCCRRRGCTRWASTPPSAASSSPSSYSRVVPSHIRSLTILLSASFLLRLRPPVASQSGFAPNRSSVRP